MTSRTGLENICGISVLEADTDEKVKQSKVYKAMLRENMELRADRDFYRSLSDLTTEEKYRLQKQVGAKFDERIQQILMDNQVLLQKHDAAYWIGITKSTDSQYAKGLEKKNTDLGKENDTLKSRVNILRQRANHLQNQYDRLLYELHPEDMPVPEKEDVTKPRPVGRPKETSISDSIEARKYRKEGWSIREIANQMGWSVGRTQTVVRSVKVDPEVVKQHRKENKAPRKKSNKTSKA